MKNKTVAIVHDWLIGGGAELVVLELHRMFPDAPIYTSYSTDEWREKLNGKVVTGYLQSWPFSKLRKFIPFLRGWWFSRLDLSGFDLVISSSGAEAKFIRVNKNNKSQRNLDLGEAQGTNEKRKENVHGSTLTAHRSSQHSDLAESVGGVGGSAVKQTNTVHISYIHAPTHYYWSRYNEYMQNPGFGFLDPLARLGLKILVGPMRRWDYRVAQRPNILIANSNYTKSGIKKYYKRDSTVIHPPVDVEYFSTPSTKYQIPNTKARKGFIITGRQTPYKRFDLAVSACTKLGLPLKVIGNGPENKKLQKLAGPTITFLGRVRREELREHLQQAEGFIFPGLDDFGIAAVEALAAGTPVIAFGQGGALDYVNSKTGLTFENQSIDSLAKALRNFKSEKFSPKTISNQSSTFSEQVFRDSLLKAINKF